MPEGQVPRLPIAFDPFEFSVRAVLGQQISVEAATTLASRIAGKTALKTEVDFPVGLDYFFPGPEEIIQAGFICGPKFYPEPCPLFQKDVFIVKGFKTNA